MKKYWPLALSIVLACVVFAVVHHVPKLFGDPAPKVNAIALIHTIDQETTSFVTAVVKQADSFVTSPIITINNKKMTCIQETQYKKFLTPFCYSDYPFGPGTTLNLAARLNNTEPPFFQTQVTVPDAIQGISITPSENMVIKGGTDITVSWNDTSSDRYHFVYTATTTTAIPFVTVLKDSQSIRIPKEAIVPGEFYMTISAVTGSPSLESTEEQLGSSFAAISSTTIRGLGPMAETLPPTPTQDALTPLRSSKRGKSVGIGIAPPTGVGIGIIPPRGVGIRQLHPTYVGSRRIEELPYKESLHCSMILPDQFSTDGVMEIKVGIVFGGILVVQMPDLADPSKIGIHPETHFDPTIMNRVRTPVIMRSVKAGQEGVTICKNKHAKFMALFRTQ